MPYKKRKKRNFPKDTNDRMRDSKRATVALGFLLANVFQWSYFTLRELFVSSGISLIIATVGLFIALSAKKEIKRHNGTLQGESRALVAYWGNLIIALISLLLFSWFLMMGILRGDFL